MAGSFGGGSNMKKQNFTVTGTFTPETAKKWYWVKIGGSGGGSQVSKGGGGAEAVFGLVACTSATTVTIAARTTFGANGGNSRFGDKLIALGGNAGYPGGGKFGNGGTTTLNARGDGEVRGAGDFVSYGGGCGTSGGLASGRAGGCPGISYSTFSNRNGTCLKNAQALASLQMNTGNGAPGPGSASSSKSFGSAGFCEVYWIG